MKKLILCSVLFLGIFACVNPQQTVIAEDFDYGKIEGNTYQNDFFDIEITYDSTWVVQNKEQMDGLNKLGGDLMAGEDKTFRAVLKASEVNSANLFALFKYEVGSAVPYNPSFILVAENIKNFPGVKKGSDYLYHAKKLLKQAELDYSFNKPVYDRMIGSKKFDVMEVTLHYLNSEIYQDYLINIINGFALGMVVSYTTDEEKGELYGMIEQVKFEE